MSKTLKDTVKELRELFPSLSDSKLAELAMKQSNFKEGTGVTVSDLLVSVRKSYWDTELTRLRVRKKPDGSMNLRDTSGLFLNYLSAFFLQLLKILKPNLNS